MYDDSPLSGASENPWQQLRNLTPARIALGRADTANGMLFWNPTLSRFCVSADYTLDVTRSVADPFPSLLYDGGLHLRLYTDPISAASEPSPLAALCSFVSTPMAMLRRVWSTPSPPNPSISI